jgi:hypothetical protein
MQLGSDAPAGVPSFDLAPDEIATVTDLICRGAREARSKVTTGMLEVPITVIVRKAMKRMKRELGLTNIEVGGEVEIDNMEAADPSILGRIDITLKFLRQFGNEEDYVAVECKRVGAGSSYSTLNSRYVTQGAVRFVNGQYAVGHGFGFMLGYVLNLPVDAVVKTIDTKLRGDHGIAAALGGHFIHADALIINEGLMPRPDGSSIRLRHLFVDMSTAA